MANSKNLASVESTLWEELYNNSSKSNWEFVQEEKLPLSMRANIKDVTIFESKSKKKLALIEFKDGKTASKLLDIQLKLSAPVGAKLLIHSLRLIEKLNTETNEKISFISGKIAE